MALQESWADATTSQEIVLAEQLGMQSASTGPSLPPLTVDGLLPSDHAAVAVDMVLSSD